MSVENAAVPDEKSRSGVDVVRWLCVLPCAYVAHWLLEGLGYGLFSFLRSPAYSEFLFPFLQYLPSGLALTFVGATVAPSRKVAVSIGLAVVWLPLVWLIHVFGQSTVGLVNYMHATGDSLGTFLGITLTVHRVPKTKPESTTSSSAASDETSSS